jgi:hypothetical protein
MMAVLFRFLLLGLAFALACTIVAYVLVRWFAPVVFKGAFVESRAYEKWCRLFKIPPKAGLNAEYGKFSNGKKKQG